MTLIVQQLNPSQDGSTTDAQAAQGESFEVENGTLVVLDAVDGRRVAVFAAGTWLSAQLEE